MEKEVTTVTSVKKTPLQELETASTQPTQVAQSSSKNNLGLWIALGSLAGLVLLVCAFMLGATYGSRTQSFGRGTMRGADNNGIVRQNGDNFGGRMGMRGGFGVRGTVTAVSDSSLTLTSTNGTNATYTIDASTLVLKNGTTAKVSDITNGATVLVRTNGATTGTPVATRISIETTTTTTPSTTQTN